MGDNPFSEYGSNPLLTTEQQARLRRARYGRLMSRDRPPPLLAISIAVVVFMAVLALLLRLPG